MIALLLEIFKVGWRWVQRLRLPFGFRTSLTKNGLGVSWGIPGLRFGLSPSGRKWISIGFPRIGLYFFRYLDGARRRQSTRSNDILFEDGEVVETANSAQTIAQQTPRNQRPSPEDNDKRARKPKWKNLL